MQGANFAERGPSRGGHDSSSRNQQNFRPICQVCHKTGHTTLKCYHRFDTSFSTDTTSNKHALLATPQAAPNFNWCPDSGATHHLTPDFANLNLKAEEYHGPNQIRIGNGIGLKVKHIGFTKLSIPSSSFLLHDVLHVPHITKNFISVHKFTSDTNTSIEFHPSYFFVQDRTTGRVLLRGLSINGLYLFPSASNKLPLSSFVFVGECTSPAQSHSRLGHPTFCIVNHVLSKFSLPIISSKIVHPCSACFSSKNKELSFSLSCTQINFPLDLIHTDVWGPSPICSKSGFKYYVSFIDVYSRYTWLYPIYILLKA